MTDDIRRHSARSNGVIEASRVEFSIGGVPLSNAVGDLCYNAPPKRAPILDRKTGKPSGYTAAADISATVDADGLEKLKEKLRSMCWYDTDYAAALYVTAQITLAHGAPIEAWDAAAWLVRRRLQPITEIYNTLERMWLDVANEWLLP